MSDGKVKMPGPIRRALFQDVPHILDSLWKRAEFVINRIGQVDLADPHRLEVRAPWMCGAFVLYVQLCIFTVFGPTLDAMCTVNNTGFAIVSRQVLGWMFCLASAALFLITLNATTSRLARKGEILARLARRRDKTLAEKAELVADARTEFIYGNLLRLLATFPGLKWPDRRALIAAFIVLFAGTVLLISPLAVLGATLITVKVDAQSCVQPGNTLLVIAQFVALVILMGGGLAIWQRWGRTSALTVFGASFALLVLVIAALWFSSTARSEAAGGFYPHVYVILIATFLLIALLARPFAWWMFRKLSADIAQKVRAALATVDLLHSPREAPDISGLRICSAFISGVAGHLLQFLLLPAFVAFVAPPDWLWLTFMFAIASVLLLAYGNLSDRWGQMLMYIDRWFLIGTPLVISIMVIVIASLRLMGVQYVSTVIDAAPVGVLFFIVVMLYVAVWFLEYWINRWLGEELLAIVGGRAQAKLGFVPCPFAPEERPVKVQLDGRYVALHGTGRLCAHGWYEGLKPVGGEPAKGVAFTTYGFAEFFAVLGTSLKDGAEMAQKIRRRLTLYFNVLNGVLIGAMIVLIAWHLNWSRPLTVEPMVNVQAANPVPLSEVTRPEPAAQVVDPLADRLVAQASATRPSIVVAASGGGTRAAVYTAVALEGVAQLDRARDVVLLSGVSGGGVSAAVFASRYPLLTTSQPGKPVAGASDPWADYVNTVSEPFIQDVLEGVGELRIAGPTSLGALLQESLERRAFSTGPQFISDLKTPALILNTAISGHPYDDSELLQGRISSPPTDAPCLQQARPYANLSGGRLIFTNLVNTGGFPQRSKDAPDLWLPYRIINYDNVKLSAASALTANFPPVFSNARVRIDPSEAAKASGACPQSYFVTDGGATENLGLVSALYALRGTLTRLAECTGEACGKISDIHILALEASAIDYDYSDDRGLGAATGGSKERINSGLTQRLIQDVREKVEAQHARLVVHYLPLPVAFRSRGGFGTHWMFPPTLSVANPHLPEKPDNSILPWVTPRDQAILDRAQVKMTLRAMFDKDDPICTRSDRINKDPGNPANTKYYDAGWNVPVQRVARWICGHDDKGRPDALKPDFQVDAWKGVVTALQPAE